MASNSKPAPKYQQHYSPEGAYRAARAGAVEVELFGVSREVFKEWLEFFEIEYSSDGGVTFWVGRCTVFVAC